MRITDIRVFLMSSVMPKPLEFSVHGGKRIIHKRDAMLIKVFTDTSLVGYGSGPATERVAAQIRNVIRPALVGLDPEQAETLRDRVLGHAAPDTQLAYGAVEVALFDLRGKMEDCPVSELLGGRVRNSIRLYACAGMYKGPAACAREAKVVKGMGFNAYKMRLAGGMQQDIETVRAVRQAVGADFHIMVEAHSWWQLGDRSYPPDSVARIATEMGYYNVTWLEDPLPPEDRTAYRQLADMRLVPLAAGERERDLSDLLSLAEGEAVDCIHTNAISQGGYQGCRRIIEVAAKHGKQFAIHCMGTRLETAIEVHLGVCYPKETVGWLEYPLFQEDGRTFTYSFPLASEILKEPLDIKNGVLLAPWGQGLGVEVNEAVVERYPYIPGPWSVMRLTTEP